MAWKQWHWCPTLKKSETMQGMREGEHSKKSVFCAGFKFFPKNFANYLKL